MAARTSSGITYFTSADAFESWLAKNHDRASDLMVGFYKKASGRGGLTYREALDLALAYGWIDGVRKRVDADSFVQRFSPRTARSNWSAANLRRVEALIAADAMKPSGMAAYERRSAKRTRRYSYENRPTSLEPAHEKTFRKHAKAWAYFQSMPPGYRRMGIWYVVSAAKDETRQRRLTALIDHCAAGRWIEFVTGTKKKSSARS